MINDKVSKAGKKLFTESKKHMRPGSRGAKGKADYL